MSIRKRGDALPAKIVIFSLLLLAFASFLFMPSQALETTEYSVGDKLKLPDPKTVYDIKIVTPSGSYIAQDQKGPISLKLEKAGTYTATIITDSGEETHKFTVRDTTIKEKTEIEPPEKNIRLNSPVRNSKIINLSEERLEKVELPPTSTNITLYTIKNNQPIKQIQSQENEVTLPEIKETVELIYYTAPPTSKEKTISERKKQVTISSPNGIHYKNVESYTTIPEFTSKKELITLYWEEQKRYLDFEASDTDNNGLLDYIEWTTPHLSDQTFEVSIKILNIQSYPVTGGNWIVEFVTEGTGNLSVEAWNGTTWSDESSQTDLTFLEIKCGNQTIPVNFQDDKAKINNFQCPHTATETSKVLTNGPHTLKFQFNDEIAYAFNDADPFETGIHDYQASGWETVTTKRTYTTPIVVAKPREGAEISMEYEAGTVLVSNIQSNSFDIKLIGGDTGSLILGNVSYIVVENGSHTLSNGLLMQAGRYLPVTVYEGEGDSASNFYTVNFHENYASAPAVIAGPMNSSADSWLTGRLDTGSISTSSADIALELDGSYAAGTTASPTDTIGWITLNRTSATDMEAGYESGFDQDPSSSNWLTINFVNTYTEPLFFSTLENGDSDPTVTGINSLTTTGVQIRSTEETIGDTEQTHATENAPWIVFENDLGITTPEITNVTNVTTDSSIIVSWLTNFESNSTVQYGTSSTSFTDSQSSSTLVNSHTIYLVNLTNATTYYYNITSCAGDNFCNTTGPFEARTDDFTAPLIYNITPTNDSVFFDLPNLSVSTSETASCEYSTSSTFSYGSGSQFVVGQGDFFHATELPDLIPGTYTYYIKCQDTNGNSNDNTNQGQTSFTLKANAFYNYSQIYAENLGEVVPLSTPLIVNLSETSLITEAFTHNPSYPTRLYINNSGYHKISYGCRFTDSSVGNRAITEAWVRLNGATEITPSRTSCYTRNTDDDAKECSAHGVLIANLSNGDYIELLAQQLKQQDTGDIITGEDCWIYAQNARRPVAQQYDSSGGQTYSDTSEITMNLDTETFTDSRAFTENTAADAIDINVDSWYKIYFHGCFLNDPQGNRQTTKLYLQNNGIEITPSYTYSYLRDSGDGDTNCNQGFLLYNLSSGDTIRMRAVKTSSESSAGTTSVTIADQSWLTLEQIPQEDVVLLYQSGNAQQISELVQTDVNFDTQYKIGESYSHTAGTSEIYFNEPGLYEVAYTFSWDDLATTNQEDRNIACAWLKLNGIDIHPSTQCDYTRGDDNARESTVSGNVLINITSKDSYLELTAQSNGRNINVSEDATWISVVPINTFIEEIPPRWYFIGANDSTPSINDYVNFSANWTDSLGLKSWQFFWDVGIGFVPAGSGTFTGSPKSGTSSIIKQIPISMEGQTLEYFFRATNIDNFQNQTRTANVSVTDTSSPTFSEESVTPSEINYGESVAFFSVIEDTTAVDSAWIEITKPDSTKETISLPNVTLTNFTTTYSSTQIGPYNATIFANDTLNNTGNTSVFYWSTFGFANVSFLSPQGGTFSYGDQTNLTCAVTDANSSSAIENYPAKFYQNNTLIGTNLTNSTGQATFAWTATGNGPLALNCTIENNSTLFYNANIKNDNTTITINVPHITTLNVNHENLQYNSGGNWYNTNWSHRKEITIPANTVTSDLTDFPMFVEILSPELKQTLDNGDDILFTSSNGQSKIPHEIETFNKTYNETDAYLAAWVKTDLSSSAETRIYVYYNNSGSANQEQITEVWTNGFSGVWHMSETSGGTGAIKDSTGNNNGTGSTGLTFNQDGQISKAIEFGGSSTDIITVQNHYTLNPQKITISLWLKNTGAWNDNDGIIDKGSARQYWIFPKTGGAMNTDYDTTGTETDLDITGLSETEWLQLTYVLIPDANFSAYVNGTFIAKEDITGTLVPSSDPLYFGQIGTYGNWGGLMDEIRISNATRSPSWINASYQNTYNPSGFYTLGEEEDPPTSATLNEYETYDNIAWVNITVTNDGDTTANDVEIYLDLLYPNGSLASFFPTQTQSCGSVAVSSNCEVEFDNSGSGFDLTTLTGGFYDFNITMNWTGGGNIPSANISEITIHHIPDSFTGYLTDAEIPTEENTTYQFNFTNPWSLPITAANATINCPATDGLQCFCGTNQSTTTCELGEISSLSTSSALFNITTNSSTPIGTYSINLTIEYTNPTIDLKIWTEYENDDLIIRPLLAVIESFECAGGLEEGNVIRGEGGNTTGYAFNIGLYTIEDVNLTWTLPPEWTNTSGALFEEVSTLGPDQKFYSNISLSVGENSSLGPNTITLTARSINATSDTDNKNPVVWARTLITELFTNNSAPLRNEPITITAKLEYDNGSIIPNQNITFQQNYTAFTNSTGYATINYTIPQNATIEVNQFKIKSTFTENESLYILSSTNITNITIYDLIEITQSNSIDLVGYGYNVTINATATSTSSIDSVYANITTPKGQSYFLKMVNISNNYFEVNFSQTWQQGRYNYTIWANNSAGFTNQTITSGNFYAETNLTINLMTKKYGYIPNEIVNLSSSTTRGTNYDVQAEQGLIVTSGATSSTQSLSNTYQLNKTFIVANSQVRGASVEPPNIRLGRVYFSSITNGYSSELTAERGSTSNTMINSYSILQAENIDVCHISHTMGDADGNDDVPLTSCDTPLPDNYHEKCFISTYHNVEATSGTSSCSEEQKIMANITNTTNLNFQRNTQACGNSVVEAQVVCFNDDTNVTPVHLGPTQFTSGHTVSIGKTINRSNSWLSYSCQSDGTGIEHANIECYIDGTTDVTCTTSTLGTSESSLQECIAYVIEFPGGRNEIIEHHEPLSTEIGDNSQFTTDFSNPVDNLGKTLGTCWSSLQDGEGNNHWKGEYPCYLSDSDTFTCERGGTGNSDPSHTMHCQIIQWPNSSFETYNPTFINNSGATDISGYLLMSVLSNSTGSWEIFETIVNDTATGKRREIQSLELFNITQIWNGPGEGSGFDTNSHPGGIYRAYVAFISPEGEILTDSSGNNLSSYDEFEIDFRPPTITLDFPANNSINFGTSIKVNFTAADPSGVDTCSLFHNKSGLFTLEDSATYSELSENYFTIPGFTENNYIKWNIYCNDSIGNAGFAESERYFYLIVPPDFTLNSTSIHIEVSEAIEGVNTTINATVYNLGGQYGTATVQFFNGDPENGGTQIDSNRTIGIKAEGGYNTTEVNWPAVIGPSNIFVIVDPPIASNGSVTELNESNNIANISIDVNSWQYFYGNATIDKLLASTELKNLTLWENETSLTGSIFISDTESIIDWTSLEALGKNRTGGNTTDDFSELDQLLNTTSFIDSVSNIFTTDGNQPRKTEDFVIRKQMIQDVPVVNSSSTDNFITGILWDTSDDSDNEFSVADEEDIIFTTKFNKAKQGAFGTYDYELNFPVRLREYDDTGSTEVYIYFELN